MSKHAPVLMVKGHNSQFENLIKSVEKANLTVEMVSGFQSLFEKLGEFTPSIIMLDMQLEEDKDAIDVLQVLAQRGVSYDITVIVFGDEDQNYVHIAALNAGADDYIVKPMNKRVFGSKLNAWMRRQNKLVQDDSVTTEMGSFNLDREKYSLIVSNNEITLQRKEFEILSLLASRPRKVFSRKEIKEIVWGDANNARNRTIDVHITNLRAKIGNDYIRTYKGVGYSFNA